jgi:hypothetical protein
VKLTGDARLGRLLAVKHELRLVGSGRHAWIPVRVPVQKHIDEVVEALVERVENLVSAARTRLA